MFIISLVLFISIYDLSLVVGIINFLEKLILFSGPLFKLHGHFGIQIL
jgi:hypothetical protein